MGRQAHRVGIVAQNCDLEDGLATVKHNQVEIDVGCRLW